MELDFRSIQIAELYVGYGITLAVLGYYALRAPWYRYREGRNFFFLLLSIFLVLTNSMIRLFFPNVEWTRYAGASLFLLFILSMTLIGYNIWHVQSQRRKREKA